MWQSLVPIFEEDGEDEEALISEFVRLSATFPEYNSLEIARVVFEKLRDPELRAGQAGLQWGNNLAIKDRIKQLQLVGNQDDEIDDKRTKLKVLEGIYKDPTVAAKDRIGAIQLHASIQGEIKKAIEQTNTEKRSIPQVVFASYPND